VIILDHGSKDGSSDVADAAGCRFCRDWNLADVVGSARGEWLMLLEPGARPIGRWIDELAEYVSMNKAPARFSGSRLHRMPLFRRLTRRGKPLETGFLLRKNDALAAARGNTGLDAMTNVRSVRKLSTELVPAWVAVEARR
jgi:hypothetical protein